MAINARSSLAVVAAAFVLAGAIAKKYEGDIRHVYTDPVGIRTVCEGHTGTGLVPGKVYSDAECAAFKRADMNIANDTVARCYRADLPVGPRAALLDMAFNLGPGGKGVKDGVCYLASGEQPTIRKLMNAGLYAEGCAEIPKWNRQRLPGITKRREAERLTCVSK